MNTKLVSAILVVLAIGVGLGIFLPRSSQVVDKDGVSLGSTPGSDFLYDTLNFNGVKVNYRKVGMLKATTTLCAIKSPAATSTLDRVAWRISTGTTTAAAITIASSTSQYATSTSDEYLADTAVASGAQGYAHWETAGAGVDDNRVGPSTWILVKTAGAGLGGYTFTGNCEASFTELP